MAKYTVTRACGHEETIQLFGKIKNREWRLENVEPYKLCYECWQAELKRKREEENKKAMQEARESGLPELQGTEKQVPWAEKIRINVLSKIEEVMNSIYKDEGNRRAIEKHIGKVAELEIAVNSIKQKTKASFWIDNRDCEKSVRHVLNLIKKEIELLKEEEQKPVIEEAKAEATVRPEEPKTETVAEIRISDNTVIVDFPEKRNDFREIVRYKLDMNWTGKHWERKIKKKNGTVEDRAAEAGHRLLAAGFPIRIYDEELRNKAINGEYEAECTRWIMVIAEGYKYEGWLAITWDKRKDDFYKVARAIGGSRWSNPYVVVPPEKFEEVIDFANMYGFKISEKAQEIIDKTRQEKENALIVNVEQPTENSGEQPSNKPPKLEVPENVEVADEFKD